MEEKPKEVDQEISQPHPFWQHISKRTLLLIVVLVAITGGLLYLALKQEVIIRQAVFPPTPTPSPAHSVLMLVPEASNSASSTQIIDAMVNSYSNKLTGAQLNLSYDPTILSNIIVKPGTYFKNPVVLLNNVDKINGKISFVLAIQPGGTQASGSGTVATISYTILPTSNKTTAISVLPKTEVTQLGVLGSVLKSSSSLTILIPQALITSPAPSAMPL